MSQTEQNTASTKIDLSAFTSYGMPMRIDGVDLAQLVRNLEESSTDEGSHDLYCRCQDALTVLRALHPQREEMMALHRQLAGEKLRADQGWARAEAKSRECIELRERIAVGAGGASQSITVGFDDLMALARQLIAEQMDDVDEEFLAGRAHGIGSLHSEILTLAKRSALAQAQDETAGDAGAAPTCRSSEKVRVVQEQNGTGLAEQSPESVTGLAPLPLQSVDHLVAALVDRDTPPGMDDEIVDWDLHGKPITHRMVESFAKTAPRPDQLALELPTGAPVIRKVGAVADTAAPGPAGASQPANDLSAVDVDQNILSVALWLYRRLPRCYGRPPHVEGPIKALARRVGTDVAECLAERGPDPVEGGAQ